MFVIVRTLEQIPVSLTTKERIRFAYRRCGGAIAVTSFTDALAFATGATIKFPAMVLPTQSTVKDNLSCFCFVLLRFVTFGSFVSFYPTAGILHQRWSWSRSDFLFADYFHGCCHHYFRPGS
eukprot:SAG31_NODE_123_length_23712_cov_41.426291_13_plen_122_part_00